MTPQNRDALLLAAGLPGVLALFLPVTDFFGPITPFQYLAGMTIDELVIFYGSEWVTTIPVLVAALQAYRLVASRCKHPALLAGPFTFGLTIQLAFLVLAARELVNSWAWILLSLVLSAGNLWLLHANVRRKRGFLVTTEILLLGTYVSVVPFWLIFLLSEGGPFVGQALMAWTCLIYLLTIIIRLRAVPNQVLGQK